MACPSKFVAASSSGFNTRSNCRSSTASLPMPCRPYSAPTPWADSRSGCAGKSCSNDARDRSRRRTSPKSLERFEGHTAYYSPLEPWSSWKFWSFRWSLPEHPPNEGPPDLLRWCLSSANHINNWPIGEHPSAGLGHSRHWSEKPRWMESRPQHQTSIQVTRTLTEPPNFGRRPSGLSCTFAALWKIVAKFTPRRSLKQDVSGDQIPPRIETDPVTKKTYSSSTISTIDNGYKKCQTWPPKPTDFGSSRQRIECSQGTVQGPPLLDQTFQQAPKGSRAGSHDGLHVREIERMSISCLGKTKKMDYWNMLKSENDTLKSGGLIHCDHSESFHEYVENVGILLS